MNRETVEERLVVAVKAGFLFTVRELVAKGVDVHFENDLALRAGLVKGYLPIVRILVECGGADVYACTDEFLRQMECIGHTSVVLYIKMRM
jgi:hypothetical protein